MNHDQAYPDPCTLFECADVVQTLDHCTRIRQCCYAHTRRSREDRKALEQKDLRAREET